ncbi:TraG/VirB4 family ATPase [Bacteroides salyersiae]|uniref:TraG/VirB4 family ATPase n=1 Tax=Bacteroides salyersiae TaxID=291644 RepID=UPI00374495C6
MLTTMRQYYRGGRYDFLLNSTENIDLLGKRFIVFEIDSIKENRELFPRRDHHHHGSLHQQDAAAERRAETAYRGRGLEGPLIGEHG